MWLNPRIYGNLVTESKHVDLNKMMESTGLFEKGDIWDYYTWLNKHTKGLIYSRIDRILENVVWLQDNLDIPLCA